MKRSMIVATVLAAVLSGSAAQAAAPACVTKLYNQIQNGECHAAQSNMSQITTWGGWVAYTAMTWTIVSGKLTTGWTSQLFSDRTNDLDEDYEQPFSASEGDGQTLTLDPSTGILTIKNHRWGFTNTFQLSCIGDMLVGSSGSTYHVINWRLNTVCPL